MMFALNLALAGCLCMLVLASPCCCEPMGGPDAVARPTRPKSFASPEDLRLYLDQLGQYFAVVGRPRFGKRTSATKPVVREEISNYQFPAVQSPQTDTYDVYDIIHYYQPQQQE